MRTVLFTVLGTLAAFSAGLAATYFVLPVVAPATVEATRAAADSLAIADSLALADSLAAGDLPFEPAADTVTVSDDSTLSSRLQVVADSVALLRRQLAERDAEIAAVRADLDAAASSRQQASDLASTLVSLEDRELSRVLNKLDFDVLRALYAESSGRNRTKLLRALEPDRAATFIRRSATGWADEPPPVATTESPSGLSGGPSSD